jgi:hypothetical protein
MKHLIFFVLLFLLATKFQAQSMRIHVQQKDKQGNMVPLTDTRFEVTLNDSIKTELTSGSDGILGKLQLDPGTYKVALTNSSFTVPETKNILITEKKMTTVTIVCTPVSSVVPSVNKKTGK